MYRIQDITISRLFIKNNTIKWIKCNTFYKRIVILKISFMKKLLPVCTVFILILSCSKNNEKMETPRSIIGNWNYSGNSYGSFLGLTKEGSVEKTKLGTTLPTQYNRFEILSDSTIKFFSNNNASIVAKYSLSDNANMLHLSGACFYDCDEWYGRILPID